MPAEAQLHIDVWSDYVCPFCYLELPVLERLQGAFGPALNIQWRAFELRPDPVPTLEPAGEYLRTTWARAVYPMAERRGMRLRLPPVQPRSRKALETAAYASENAQFDAMHRAIFKAFFEDGSDIGRIDVLLEIAASVGLDSTALRRALQDGRYTERVIEDETLAQRLAVSAVPTMLLRRSAAPWQDAVPISGALPYEQIHATVDELLRGENTPLR